MIETTPKLPDTLEQKLINAVLLNDMKAVVHLVKAGANVNVKGVMTLLMFTALEGCFEIARLLIANGADVNAKNRYGMTALMYAAIKGDIKVAELLIANGADINAKDNHGMTPLMWATANGNVKVAEFLIANGADVNAKDNHGMTPLMWAATKKGNIETVKCLIANGADINAKDRYGMTALMYAVKTGDIKVAKYLLVRGARVVDTSKEGKIVPCYAKNETMQIFLMQWQLKHMKLR